MTTRNDFCHAFLNRLQKPMTGENVIGGLTWIRSEFGGATPIPARWNPLATTKWARGSTPYNEVGVRNFASFEDGVEACAATLELHEPGYQAIRDLLDNGNDAGELVAAIHRSAWGSKPDAGTLAYVRQHEQIEMLLSLGEGGTAPSHGPVPQFPAYPGHLLRNRTEGHGTRTWQHHMAKRGWSIAVDDIYGPQSERVCEAFQSEKGLAVDGIVGPITWGATWTAPITH